jgi:hypothetical protein
VRSRPEVRILPLAAALIAIVAIAAMTPALRAEGGAESTQGATQDSTQAQGAGPTEAEIAQAIETVKKDPNLDTEMTVKTLRWTGPRQTQKKPDGAVFLWLRDLINWFERSARLLVWAGGAILAGWLLIYLVRLVGKRGPRKVAPDEFVAPTHVRDLDIRPEALPADIGAAARALWDRGDERAALVLLYRGLLSRLAHVHRVPIRDSSTEGDCLTLAADHLAEPSRRDYASRLIQVWRSAVYARQEPSPAAVYDLCDAFARALDLAPPATLSAAAAVRSSASLPGGAR